MASSAPYKRSLVLAWVGVLILAAYACDGEDIANNRGSGVDKIAFLSCCEPKTALHVMNSDGTERIELSDDLSGLPFPLWSPDGSRIAYTRFLLAEKLDDSAKSVWVATIGGSQDMKVSGEGHAGDPTWSPDGRKLAFIRTEVPLAGQVFGEIYTVNADGSDLKRLTELDREAGKADMLPIWSPDGSKIAHLHGEGGRISLRVMNSDGSDPQDIFDEPINEHLPMIWSPDSKRIVVYAGREYSNDLVIVSADGSGSVSLTEDGTGGGYASWSPDGDQIAYTSIEGLFIADADGQRQVSRIRSEGPDGPSPELPIWSPDGERIAIVMGLGLDDHEIKIIDVEGAGGVTIETDTTKTPTISWSPDGRRLAFDDEVDGEGEIFVVNADGTGPRNLTNSPSSEHEPIWSR